MCGGAAKGEIALLLSRALVLPTGERDVRADRERRAVDADAGADVRTRLAVRRRQGDGAPLLLPRGRANPSSPADNPKQVGQIGVTVGGNGQNRSAVDAQDATSLRRNEAARLVVREIHGRQIGGPVHDGGGSPWNIQLERPPPGSVEEIDRSGPIAVPRVRPSQKSARAHFHHEVEASLREARKERGIGAVDRSSGDDRAVAAYTHAVDQLQGDGRPASILSPLLQRTGAVCVLRENLAASGADPVHAHGHLRAAVRSRDAGGPAALGASRVVLNE